MSYITEIKRHVLTYTLLVWNSLFEISRVNNEDPVKAYRMLNNLIPLLPKKVIDAVVPLINVFEKRITKEKKKLRELYRDSVSSDLVFTNYMRSELSRFIRELLYVISVKMEELGLKYQVEAIPVGGEKS
jgi:hypothetical protein